LLTGDISEGLFDRRADLLWLRLSDLNSLDFLFLDFDFDSQTDFDFCRSLLGLFGNSGCCVAETGEPFFLMFLMICVSRRSKGCLVSLDLLFDLDLDFDFDLEPRFDFSSSFLLLFLLLYLELPGCLLELPSWQTGFSLWLVSETEETTFCSEFFKLCRSSYSSQFGCFCSKLELY
jgi:hypothetical protein